MTIKEADWKRDCLWLAIAIGVLFSIGLGARPYLAPSEARYIEIPRQMLATGDWLTPRINGVPYFEKPPLFYWMQAVALSIFGMQEWAGRIVTVLLDIGICLLTYATARMLYGRRAGWLAAMALSTSLLGYGLSRVAMLDMPVSIFITASLTAFLAAQQPAFAARRSLLYRLMVIASALAMMSKGLIGIVIPGLVIGVWIVATRRWYVIAEAKLFTGLLIFLLIAAPWHMLMAQHHPLFLNFYFIHEHFTRYLTDEHKRPGAWWFFIAISLAGFMPWTGLLPPAIHRMMGGNWHKAGQDHNALFLLLWVLLPLVFFSTSHSKLVAYIFPIFPPLAIITGRLLAELWEGQHSQRPLRIAGFMVIFIAVLAAAGARILPTLHGNLGHKLAALHAITLPMLLPLIAVLIGLSVMLIRKRPAHSLIVALALVGAVTGISVNEIVAPLDPATVKPLAQPLQGRLKPGDLVAAYGNYWQDLPVYLNQNIIVAGWTGELAFGVENYPETQEWMISTDTFWARCSAAKQAVYVFMTDDAFDGLAMPAGCQLHISAKYGKTLLLERQTP